MSTLSVAQMTGQASAGGLPYKPEITHIEIRRVQNGFVLAGINMHVYDRLPDGDASPQRVSYVAKDTKELGDLISWFVDGGEIGWLPTINLPLFDMAHRPGLSPKELGEVVTDAVRQGIMQAAPSPVSAQGHGIDPYSVFGGPLNRGR